MEEINVLGEFIIKKINEKNSMRKENR